MFRRLAEQHFIDRGRVHCPLRRRDVEFDVCAGCRWASGIDLEATPPVVQCRPEQHPVWLFRPWL
jgi:hypothetical protein